MYEVGELDGQWFCAMERCDGSVAGLAPLPPRAVVDVGLAVCAALQYAHEELALVASYAEIMGAQANAPFLRTRRIVRDGEGRVIEYVVSLLDPGHFALHLEY